MNEVTPELLAAARKGKRDAVVELLAMHYGVVWRMATGLTGRADVGRGVVKFVMQRSLRAMSHWKEEGAPARWFHHHTVLTTRRTAKHRPDTVNDTFINHAAGDVQYAAFVRALRALPMQQREAFVLSTGEKFNTRQLAVAMDCSIVAADNHLREATERLRELAADKFDAHAARMALAYQKLAPDEELAIQNLRKRVGRIVLPWIIRRIFSAILALILLAAAAWGGWWAWQIVRHSLEM
jgi:DNA-directed RNA polymerase specialized sigma24 family protein